MRVAICFSGFLRNFEHTFPRTKMFLFDVWKPDVFFAGYPSRGDADSTRRFLDLYRPVRSHLAEYTTQLRDELRTTYDYGGFWNVHHTTNVDGMLSQYTNLRTANDLKKDYERANGFTYDVVIKSRLDMFWSRPVMIGELNACKAGFLLVPGTWDFKSVNAYAMTDCFAMSNSPNMDSYSNIIEHLQAYNREGCACHHESMTGWHARKTGLEQVRVSCEPHLWFEYPVEFDHLPLEDRDRKLY